MKTLKVAFGFAILLAFLLAMMLVFLDIQNLNLMWRIVIFSVGSVIGIALIIWGLIGISKKDISDPNVGMSIEGYKSVEPSTLRRIKNWLHNN